MLQTGLWLKNKEKNKCAWKKVMNDSSNGKGTSYNMNKLSTTQAECFKCSGFNANCTTYIPFN